MYRTGRLGKSAAFDGDIMSEMAHPTRFERVTFAFGGQRSAWRCDDDIPLQQPIRIGRRRLPITKIVIAAQWRSLEMGNWQTC